MRHFVIFAAVTVMSVCAGAQQAEVFKGKWTGTMENPQGRELKVEVVFEGAMGKWRVVSTGRGNACLNKDLPFFVSSQSNADVSIKLNGSSVVQGCSDNVISLKLVDAKTLEGAVEDGRKVKLVRE